MIAEANGLTSASLLTPGQTITVPARVGNVHNTSQTFRPYDPNQTLGDVSPTQVKPPKSGGGCGPIGQMLMVVIAVAVAAIVAPYIAGALASSTGAGMGLATATGVATGSTAAGGAVAATTTTYALTAAGTFVAGAAAGAAASIASQAFGMAMGIQDKLDWKGVGLAALSGSLGKLSFASRFGQFVSRSTGSGLAGDLARGALSSAVTQGVGVATGLQHKFNWASVAVSAISAGFGTYLPDNMAGDFASGVIGVGVQSVLEGSSFGDNLLSQLPHIIGQTIGNQIARGESAPTDAADSESGPAGQTSASFNLSGRLFDLDDISFTEAGFVLSDGTVLRRSDPEAVADAASDGMPAGFRELLFADAGDGSWFASEQRRDVWINDDRITSGSMSGIDITADSKFRLGFGQFLAGEQMYDVFFNADSRSLQIENALRGRGQQSLFGGAARIDYGDTAHAEDVVVIGRARVAGDVVTGSRPWTPGRVFGTFVDYTGLGLMGILKGGVVDPFLGAAEFAGTTFNTLHDGFTGMMPGNSAYQLRARDRFDRRLETAWDNTKTLGYVGARLATDRDYSYRGEIAENIYTGLKARYSGGPEGFMNFTSDLTSLGVALLPTRYAAAPGDAATALNFLDDVGDAGRVLNRLDGMPNPYVGVREASAYLQAQGVSRGERVRILQSFDTAAITVREAGASEFGLRYYSDASHAGGSYLFETFPASRSSLAIKPEWSTMSGFRQFQIRSGSTILEGPASRQGPYLPGGQTQKFVYDWRTNLLDTH